MHFAREAQTALDQVIAACAKDSACHAAFPDTRGEIDGLLARLDKQPAHVSIKDPKTGKPLNVAFGRSAAAQTIRYMLYDPITAAQIPLRVHMAAQGDLGPLAETAYLFGNLMTSTADGFYLSVTCAEDVRFFTPDEAEKASRGTFLGDFRARAQKAACTEWPRGETPPDVNEPVRSDAPTLLISGERDPVTPAAWGEQAARTLSRSKHVVVPGGGHGFDGEKGTECLDRLARELVERGSEKDLDTSCVAKIEPVPFALKDDRAAEIDLPAAELDRFAGTYAGPTATRSSSDARRLAFRVVLGEGGSFRLAPIAPARFRIEGAPPGFFVEFQRDGGAVTGLQLQMGPNDRETLKRK